MRLTECVPLPKRWPHNSLAASCRSTHTHAAAALIPAGMLPEPDHCCTGLPCERGASPLARMSARQTRRACMHAPGCSSRLLPEPDHCAPWRVTSFGSVGLERTQVEAPASPGGGVQLHICGGYTCPAAGQLANSKYMHVCVHTSACAFQARGHSKPSPSRSPCNTLRLAVL